MSHIFCCISSFIFVRTCRPHFRRTYIPIPLKSRTRTSNIGRFNVVVMRRGTVKTTSIVQKLVVSRAGSLHLKCFPLFNNEEPQIGSLRKRGWAFRIRREAWMKFSFVRFLWNSAISIECYRAMPRSDHKLCVTTNAIDGYALLRVSHDIVPLPNVELIS